MSVTFGFEGGAALQAALRELGDSKAIKTAARQALRKAIAPVRTRARELVPVDQGKLRQSIKVAADKSRERDQLWVKVGIDRSVDPPRQKPQLSGGGSYRDPGVAGHSVIIEFGRAGVPAQPFLTPAMDAELPGAIGRLTTELWPAIERAAARLARRAR